MNHFDEHQAHAAQTLNARLDDSDDFLAAVDAATNHYAQETTFAQVAAQNAAIGTPMGTARINVNRGPRKDFGKGSVHFTVAASPAALEDWAYFVSAPNNTYNDQVRGRATEANVCATDVETIIEALPAYAQQGSPELVLRDLPETREKDGLAYMALQNEPRGLPKGVTLESGPLYLTSLVKQWRTPDGRKTRCS